MKMITIVVVCLILGGCVSASSTPEQQLVLEKDIYAISRSETIDAVKECEPSRYGAIEKSMVDQRPL